MAESPTKPAGAPTPAGAAGTQQNPTIVTPPKVAGGNSGGAVPAGVQGLKPVAPAVPAGPPFTIVSVHEAVRYLKLLVYGTYGIGKTRLVASGCLVPQMQDILFIDAESGDTTVSTIDDPDFGKGLNHIDTVRVTSFKEFARVQEFLKLHCKFRDAGDDKALKDLEMKLKPGSNPDAPPRKYYTAVIDSLSELETFSMYQLLGISDRTRLDEETASPEWAEYKRNHNQILRAVRAFRDLPMNILMTAATQYVQDEQKRFIYQVALTGKLANQVQGFMDVVGFLASVQGEDGKSIRRMFVQPQAKFSAKCRFSNYKAPYFDDPDMKKILGAVGLLETVGGKK